MSLQIQEPVPDLLVEDTQGRSFHLGEFRQKSHLVLIYDPSASPNTAARWEAAVEADRAQWEWLNVTVRVIRKAPKDLKPGVYAIDRDGRLISALPTNRWSFDDLEREFVHHEARHC